MVMSDNRLHMLVERIISLNSVSRTRIFFKKYVKGKKRFSLIFSHEALKGTTPEIFVDMLLKFLGKKRYIHIQIKPERQLMSTF